MAQTGYTPILIYSSSTAAAAPIAGNLTNSTLGSELAINITDGKLFYKDNANAIQVIGWKTTPTTAGGTGLTSYTAGDLLYYASGTALSKLGIGAANTVLTSSGSAPQWSTNLNIGSLTATSISNSGNLTFTGTGNRIIGDFSNATVANRVMFQTSTLNSATSIYAIPNGTSTTSQFVAVSNSDPTNASVLQLLSLSTDAQIRAGVTGTGTLVPLTLYAGGAERLRLFTSGGVSIGNTTDPGATNLSVNGRLFVGTATSAAYGPWSAGLIQAAGTTEGTSVYSFSRFAANQGSPILLFNKSRGASIGTNTVVVSGDNLGLLDFLGADGTNFVRAATITAQVDGTPGTNDMPGRLVFSTTADGASSPTERVRVNNAGITQFNSNLVMPYQGAPTSKAALATLSGAELITGILETTGTTYTITLPTGTDIEGALLWSANNVALDWWVINTASGTITIGANGNTTLGALTIATGTSAHFRIRRTAANTFTVYRLS